MDLEQFTSLKEKYKDDAELTSALAKIESEATALLGKKDTAVGNEQKLREVKQTIAELMGFEKDIPVNDLASKAKETLDGFKNQIDSFKNNASGKDLENANIKEQLAGLTTQLNELTGQLSDEKATNQLNSQKDKARKALADKRITDPKAQDLVINANISQLSSISDFTEFATTSAEQYPNLTDTVHKSGPDSKIASEAATKELASKEITHGMSRDEEIAIRKAKREHGEA